MGKEIERKFLVISDAWREGVKGTLYRQGYLSTHKERTVRVRSIGDKGILTIKGLKKGATSPEYEYDVPVQDVNEMLNNLCEKPLIKKTRYKISFKGRVWEVDEFHGINQGLVLAEIELKDEKAAFDRPEWLGKEVTDDPRYFSSKLVTNPYSTW